MYQNHESGFVSGGVARYSTYDLSVQEPEMVKNIFYWTKDEA